MASSDTFWFKEQDRHVFCSPLYTLLEFEMAEIDDPKSLINVENHKEY